MSAVYEAAEHLADLLERENAALQRLDLPSATALLGAKRAALAVLEQAARGQPQPLEPTVAMRARSVPAARCVTRQQAAPGAGDDRAAAHHVIARASSQEGRASPPLRRRRRICRKPRKQGVRAQCSSVIGQPSGREAEVSRMPRSAGSPGAGAAAAIGWDSVAMSAILVRSKTGCAGAHAARSRTLFQQAFLCGGVPTCSHDALGLLVRVRLGTVIRETGRRTRGRCLSRRAAALAARRRGCLAHRLCSLLACGRARRTAHRHGGLGPRSGRFARGGRLCRGASRSRLLHGGGPRRALGGYRLRRPRLGGRGYFSGRLPLCGSVRARLAGGRGAGWRFAGRCAVRCCAACCSASRSFAACRRAAGRRSAGCCDRPLRRPSLRCAGRWARGGLCSRCAGTRSGCGLAHGRLSRSGSGTARGRLCACGALGRARGRRLGGALRGLGGARGGRLARKLLGGGRAGCGTLGGSHRACGSAALRGPGGASTAGLHCHGARSAPRRLAVFFAAHDVAFPDLPVSL